MSFIVSTDRHQWVDRPEYGETPVYEDFELAVEAARRMARDAHGRTAYVLELKAVAHTKVVFAPSFEETKL